MAHGVLFLLSAEYSVVMCVAWPGAIVTRLWLHSQYDILLCSEILVLDMRHVSEILVPGFGLLCRDKMPHARGMAAYVRDGSVSMSPTQRLLHSGCC